jgi:two-component system, NarL family, nitrate/nitrite response regulator NarL
VRFETSDPGVPRRWRAGRPARVLLADDHPLTRLGLRHAIGCEAFVVCAEVGDAEAAVAATLREGPDICLLDVHMPGGGIVAAERIAELAPAAAVVMISASTDDATVFAAFRAGALGFLLKDGLFSRLPDALLGVLNGEAAVPREMTARLIGEFRRGSRIQRLPGLPAGFSLTSRETDVLELLLRGLGTAEIGGQLHLASTTVRTHVAALLRKFGVKDRLALLALIRDPGLLVDGRSA